MELWERILAGVGGAASALAIIYAHIAHRASRAASQAATDANALARESNETAKDAKRLAEEANEISHRSEQREIERHDVRWEGDWQEPGVFVLVKRGEEEARDVVATVWADGEEQTQRAHLILEEGARLVFEFPAIAEAVRREAAVYHRQQAADSANPCSGIAAAGRAAEWHNGSERVQWSTKRGTPKIHEEDRRLESFEHFY